MSTSPGTLGDCALGLQLLLANADAGSIGGTAFVGRWRCPDIPFHLAGDLHHFATAAVDISDGFVQDLLHLCTASKVGATIELSRLPIDPNLRAVAERVDQDPLQLALHGGEDYQLIFTSPERELSIPNAMRIGQIEEQQGIRLVDQNGEKVNADPKGFEHRWS